MGQTLQSLAGHRDGFQIFLKGDLLGRVTEFDAGQVTQMRQRPIALTQVTMAQTQQKTFETLARFALIDHRAVTRPHQITHGFILLIGHVNGCQLTGTEQPGELPRIAPIGLDAVTGLGRDEGRSNYLAIILTLFQVPINDITARPGFIHETQFQLRPGQFLDELIEGLERATNLPVNLSGRVPFGGSGHDD